MFSSSSFLPATLKLLRSSALKVSERARLDAGAHRLGSQIHCRHLWLHSRVDTINRRYREVHRCPGPGSDLCCSDSGDFLRDDIFLEF